MCLFCKIANQEIAGKILFEDEHLVAFSKKHIVSLNEATPADAELLGRLVLAAQRVAREAKLADAGWRLVVNNGAHAGQSVFHVHLHVLGGRQMAWPPG
jgi:histidine triad (HIT) family protein